MTDTDRAERVARAICRKELLIIEDISSPISLIDEYVERDWIEWMPHARAAIAEADTQEDLGMDKKLYMDGIGITQQTRDLTNAAWDTVLSAIFGLLTAFIGPFICWVFLVHHFPWDLPPTTIELTIAAFISACSVVGGVAAFLPYWKAMRGLKKHTRAMKAETDRYGAGWASS